MTPESSFGVGIQVWQARCRDTYLRLVVEWPMQVLSGDFVQRRDASMRLYSICTNPEIALMPRLILFRHLLKLKNKYVSLFWEFS